ncbi:MAG: hypothetical protein ACXADB_11470 [Candidatus Hermodarchaeia archaeon]|jgi:hypothetical protein
MAGKAKQSQKKRGSGLRIGLIIIIVIVVLALLLLLVWGSASGIASLADTVADTARDVAGGIEGVVGGSGPISTTKFISNMHILTLRNDDFPIAYKHTTNRRISNDYVIGQMTVELGKSYILDTGRLDGWDTYIEKLDLKDIGPSFYQTRVEIFETNEGAEIAFSPKYLWVYTNLDRAPDEILDENCEFGNECLYLSYVDVTPGTSTVLVRWDYVFRHKNVIAWVYVKGTDIETFEEDAYEAAKTVYDRLLALE